MTDTPPTRDTLPQREIEEIFETSIRPLMSGPAKEQPVAVFIGGQPGAGKSTLEAHIVEAKGLQDAVRLDGDDLLLFHPRYREHALDNDRTAAVVCSDPRWWNMAVEHIREQRADVVISSPLAGPEWAQARFQDFRDAGYRVEAVFVAVDDARSQLGIIDRYQNLRDDQGFGRWVGPEWHDIAYDRVLATADAIDRDGSTDAVHVGRRGGEIVHSNELAPDRGWRLPVPTRAVIEAERARPWTAQEQAQFKARVESLAGRVSEDLKPLLARTVERGQAHVAAVPSPGGIAAAAAARSASQPTGPTQQAGPSQPAGPSQQAGSSPQTGPSRPSQPSRAGSSPAPAVSVQPHPQRPVSSGGAPRSR